jgi:hypothetical protein
MTHISIDNKPTIIPNFNYSKKNKFVKIKLDPSRPAVTRTSRCSIKSIATIGRTCKSSLVENNRPSSAILKVYNTQKNQF